VLCSDGWAGLGSAWVDDSSKKVLIAPASVLRAEVGASFLDRAFMRVRTAGSGAEAFAMTRAWAPDLVIIGTGLADTTAAALANRLRRDVDPKIKLVLLTEMLEPDPAGEELAADAHLVEPIDSRNLLVVVSELLDVPPRRGTRVAVRLLARLGGAFEEPGPASALVNLLSLSESGVLVEAPGPLQLAARGTLQLVLPGAGARLALGLRVRVLIDEIRLHYGAEFEDVDEAARQSLRDYVAARLGRGGGGEEPEHEFDRD
jgi:CheY-like chemotaxis protein